MPPRALQVDDEATVAEVVPPSSARQHRRSTLSRQSFTGKHWSFDEHDGGNPPSPRWTSGGAKDWNDLPDLRVSVSALSTRVALLGLLRRATLDSHKLLRPEEVPPRQNMANRAKIAPPPRVPAARVGVGLTPLACTI